MAECRVTLAVRAEGEGGEHARAEAAWKAEGNNEMGTRDAVADIKGLYAYVNKLLTVLSGAPNVSQSEVDEAAKAAEAARVGNANVTEGADDDEVARQWLEEQPEDSDDEDGEATKRSRKAKKHKPNTAATT